MDHTYYIGQNLIKSKQRKITTTMFDQFQIAVL